MIKSFTYTNMKSETSTRIVNIVHESESMIQGFDYKYLNSDEQAAVNKVYGNEHKPTPFPTVRVKMTDEDYKQLGISKELFKKAFRTFKKASIK